MVKFSDKYGYTKPSDVIIREQLTREIINSILNWIHYIDQCLTDTVMGGYRRRNLYEIEQNVWSDFLNNDLHKCPPCNINKASILTDIIEKPNIAWHYKLNLIEFILNSLRGHSIYDDAILLLNYDFEKHNFAYRVINGCIEEITSETEIKSIEDALENPMSSVTLHLQTALKHLSSAQKEPDYRNSIKESISAVEAYCREKTGEDTLGKALLELKKQHVQIPDILKKAFDLLYGYTNDKSSGIRHALLDESNPPDNDEAIFMLVSCSAFINYLSKK